MNRRQKIRDRLDRASARSRTLLLSAVHSWRDPDHCRALLDLHDRALVWSTGWARALSKLAGREAR